MVDGEPSGGKSRQQSLVALGSGQRQVFAPPSSVSHHHRQPPIRAATLTSPLELHMGRRASARPNLIVNWVHRLEKLNATLDNETTTTTVQQESTQKRQSESSDTSNSKRPAQQQQQHQHQTQQQQQQQQHHQIVTIIGATQPEADRQRQQQQAAEEAAELCFKAAQLVTEFLLMLFAASLLIIAAIVAASSRRPAFMESYEIVPEILFFLCVFVAIYSFVRWVGAKLGARFECCARVFGRGERSVLDYGKGDSNSLAAKREDGTKHVAQASEKRADETSRGRQPVVRTTIRRDSLRDESLGIGVDENRKLLATPQNRRGSDGGQARTTLLLASTGGVNPSNIGCAAGNERPVPTIARPWSGGHSVVNPPTRQVAFDTTTSANYHGMLSTDESARLTINEEDSDAELSCASA